MNCQQVRKYIGAFADGELEVHHNLEVLEHVNMCPTCARRAEEVAQLRAALRRLWERETAPPELHGRVRAAIANDALLEPVIDTVDVADAPTIQFGTGITPAKRRLTRLLVPLTLAASLIAAIAVWQFWPTPQMHRGTATMVYARAAGDVRAQHQHCVTTFGMNHHDESLSRDMQTISNRLSSRLGMDVITPELTPFGYNLVGADRCGILGRPAAHILYQSPTEGEMLSVFTVARMAEMIPDGLTRLGGQDFYLNTDAEPTVVAWHEAGETHIVCAKLAPSRLLEIAGDARTAMAKPFFAVQTRLASLKQP